jgi:hypothetical protein
VGHRAAVGEGSYYPICYSVESHLWQRCSLPVVVLADLIPQPKYWHNTAPSNTTQHIIIAHKIIFCAIKNKWDVKVPYILHKRKPQVMWQQQKHKLCGDQTLNSLHLWFANPLEIRKNLPEGLWKNISNGVFFVIKIYMIRR